MAFFPVELSKQARGLRVQLAGSGLALLLGIGIGCSGGTEDAQEARRSVLSIGVAAPAGSMDPGSSQVATLLTNESLVTVGNDGRTAPRLTERWNRSPDGLTWRLYLRRGVRFHDGSLLTAEVVRDRIRNVFATGSAIGPSFADVVAVESEGDETLVIRLRKPTATLLNDLVEVDVVRIVKGQRASTGPYYVESRTEDRIVLRGFPQYREGPPLIDRLELRSFPTVRLAWSAMMRGEVDFLYEVGPEAAEFLESESSVQTFSFLRAYTLTLGFNMRHPVLRSAEVRRALNSAIDRDGIVRSVFRGRGRTASGPIWPGHWTFSAAVPIHTYNRAAAEIALSGAGYDALREQGPNDMPSRFRFHCLVYAPLERVALLVQKQLFEIGVDMSVELVSLEQLPQRLGTGAYDAFLFWLIGGRSLTWPYLFWHSPEPNRPTFIRSGYTAADRSLDRMRYARDDEDLRSAVADLQQVMYDDPPAIFLAWTERIRAVSRKFDVPPVEPGRDITASLWRWRPASAEVARVQ